MDYDQNIIEQARSEHELLFEDPGSAKKRARADRKRRRKYKFTDKKHSLSGIAATILVIPEIAFIVIAIYLSTVQKGQGTEVVGWLPFTALLLATIGIIMASFSFRKPDTIYTFSWTGLVSSLVVWLFVAVMMVSGM